MPLGLISVVATTVFAYLSWLKSDELKKFCFLFGLCSMAFTTSTLIANWFLTIQIRNGNNFNFFYFNLEGNMAYASFVSLILTFVIAIIACAYNYFLDNFDDEEEEDEEEEELPKKSKKVVEEDEEDEEVEEKPVKKTKTAKTSE